MQTVLGARSGDQIDNAVIALHKLTIPNVQPAGGHRRGHAFIGKANSQIADGIALGISQIKIRHAVCRRERRPVLAAKAKHFADGIVVHRGKNRRKVGFGFTIQSSDDLDAAFGIPIWLDHRAAFNRGFAVEQGWRGEIIGFTALEGVILTRIPKSERDYSCWWSGSRGNWLNQWSIVPRW